MVSKKSISSVGQQKPPGTQQKSSNKHARIADVASDGDADTCHKLKKSKWQKASKGNVPVNQSLSLR